MKKLFMWLITLSSMLFSAKTECLTDVYFANGIKTEKRDAINNAGLLRTAIKDEFGLGYYNERIGKVDYAYNETHGFGWDGLESALQKFGWAGLTDYFASSHGRNLTTQVNAYKTSITSGHRVLMVAHSQGNLFAFDAFNALPGWMQSSVDAISIASPMSADIKFGTPRFDWDNDLVPRIASFGNRMPWMENSLARNVVWEDRHPGVAIEKPIDNYVEGKYVNQLYGHRWKAIENGLNSSVHAFTFYMGQEIKDSDTEKVFISPFSDHNITDNALLIKIMTAIETVLNNDSGCPCSSKNTKPVVTKNGAIEMTLSWDHQCDIDMDLEMKGSAYIVQDVKDVEEVGKEHTYIESRYQIHPGDHYDFYATGKELPDSHLDKTLLDEEPIGIRALLETPTGSYFKVWEVKDVRQLDIGKFAELDVEEDISPVWVCPALNDVPGWYNLYNHDTGNFQCIQCEDPYTVVWIKTDSQSPGYWRCNRPLPPRISDAKRTYNQCTEEEKKSSCGCVPCEYIVSGMDPRVENGPIAGADVTIIRASDAGVPGAEVLWRGKTTDKEDIFKSGMIEIAASELESFDDDTYYLVMAKGGRDIDRDDDMNRDIVPTENGGTMHAIIRGSDLKHLPFRINVLTEVAYQVMGDAIGSGYEQNITAGKLDAIARRVLGKKLNPADSDPAINYNDMLLWTPAVDKKALFKPYDIYVEPIIEKVYADEARYEESYRLVYEAYDSDAPQLMPLALEIPENLPEGTVIAVLRTQDRKGFATVELTGRYAEHFRVDEQGYLRIAEPDLVRMGNVYRLQMAAVDAEGNRGGTVSLDVKVSSAGNINDPTASVPKFVAVTIDPLTENAAAGTEVGSVTFEDANGMIVGYRVSGEENASFTIDDGGVIRVAEGAEIDYERAKLYTFEVSAYNDAGNESYPVSVSVPIENELDTPLFDLVVFEHIEENVAIGSVLTQIEMAREGKGKIEKFEILSPNIPFSIDVNGTVRVTGFIDYEQTKKYDFYAIARTRYGNSNKVEFHIVVDDQEPEVGLPVLRDAEFTVDENASSKTAIGRIMLDEGAEALDRIALYGESEHFRIDTNGTIYLKKDATLDYEKKVRYDLGVMALNPRGWSNEAHIVVHVNNVADELPALGAFRGNVDENVPAGTLVGIVQIGDASELSIDTMTLTGEGSEHFVVDRNGTIRVADGATLDYEEKQRYYLKAVASSDTGYQREAEVIIDVNNVPEFVPVLKSLSASIEESAPSGSTVGQVEVVNPGDTAIRSFDLNGSSNFVMNSEGLISTAQVLDWKLASAYTLYATAENDAGRSQPVEVSIQVLRIHYEGSDGADTLTGSSRDERFDMKVGDDTVHASSGNDTLIGGKGNDALFGGEGDDLYIYTLGDGNDTIRDTQGEDRLVLHQIAKETLYFTLRQNDLLLHIEEDNGTIVIENWKENSHKIEEIIFDDGTKISLDNFNLPIVLPDAGVVDLSKLGNSSALQVVEGRIIPLEPGYDSVDHWEFYYAGGTLEIDLLSELASNGQTYIDIDRDGVQTGVDVYIYLYKKDANGNWQTVAGNDDSSNGRADGSSHSYDSYLNVDLSEGEYMLAVSNYSLSASTALGHRNPSGSYPNGGPYQITFNTRLEFTNFPDNAQNNLYGSDHYNFYVLRNDMDPYNMDGLHIENAVVINENGVESEILGSVKNGNGYISYYPEDVFSDMNESLEVNIAYDVVNRNGMSVKSLLTLKVIPSLYTHIEPEVNQTLWEAFKSGNAPMELNIIREQ